MSNFTVTIDSPCEIDVPVKAAYFIISNATDAMNAITVKPIA